MVVAGGKHHQVFTAAKCCPIREAPLVRLGRIISEEVSAQVDGKNVRVVDLYPVGKTSVIISKVGIIGSKELAYGRCVDRHVNADRHQG